MQQQRFLALIDWGEGKWWAQWREAYLRTALMFWLTCSDSTMVLSRSNRKDDFILPMLNHKPNFSDFMIQKQDSPRRIWWAGSLHENIKSFLSMQKFDRA